MESTVLEQSLRRRAELARQRKALDEEITNIDGAIVEYLTERGVDTESAGGFTAKRVAGTRSTLDKARLVELGVLPSVIQQATKVTTYYSLRVTADQGATAN